jgi:GrpB-like predicted nucleotidyltransferase (UPF0157 family)
MAIVPPSSFDSIAEMGDVLTDPAEIRVVDHDAGWRRAFEAEHDRLRAVLGPLGCGVEHIGSTAVPGLAAKPILDIMVGVARQELVEAAVSRLAELDYDRRPAGDFPGRTFLRRIDTRGRVTHHLSLTVKGGGYWRDQLTFRDALRRDPYLVRRYADLKRELAARSPHRDIYTREKTAFVREVLLGVGHVPQTGWASEAPGSGD